MRGAHIGQVLNELGDMMRYRAKDVDETRKMVTEMVSRIKIAEEVTGERISEPHARTILLGFLDDVTRQHTTQFHGSDRSFVQFKNAVDVELWDGSVTAMHSVA